MAYLLMVFPCFFSIAIMFKNVFGYKLLAFESVTTSLLSLFLLTEGHASPTDLITFNAAFGLIFSIIFYLFTLHFFFAVFSGIVTTSFRGALDMYGYPGDEKAGKKFSIKDMAKWVVACLPDTCLVRMGLLDSLATNVKSRDRKLLEAEEENKEAATAN